MTTTRPAVQGPTSQRRGVPRSEVPAVTTTLTATDDLREEQFHRRLGEVLSAPVERTSPWATTAYLTNRRVTITTTNLPPPAAAVVDTPHTRASMTVGEPVAVVRAHHPNHTGDPAPALEAVCGLDPREVATTAIALDHDTPPPAPPQATRSAATPPSAAVSHTRLLLDCRRALVTGLPSATLLREDALVSPGDDTITQWHAIIQPRCPDATLHLWLQIHPLGDDAQIELTTIVSQQPSDPSGEHVAAHTTTVTSPMLSAGPFAAVAECTRRLASAHCREVREAIAALLLWVSPRSAPLLSRHVAIDRDPREMFAVELTSPGTLLGSR